MVSIWLDVLLSNRDSWWVHVRNLTQIMLLFVEEPLFVGFLFIPRWAFALVIKFISLALERYLCARIYSVPHLLWPLEVTFMCFSILPSVLHCLSYWNILPQINLYTENVKQWKVSYTGHVIYSGQWGERTKGRGWIKWSSHDKCDCGPLPPITILSGKRKLHSCH